MVITQYLTSTNLSFTLFSTVSCRQPLAHEIDMFMTSKQSKGKVSQKPAPGSVTGKETKLIRADRPPKYEIKDLVSVAKRLGATPKTVADDSDGELVDSKSIEPSRIEGDLLKTMIKSMFKADHPYRTKLGYYNNVATSAAGVLNFSINVNTIGNVAEWGSIDALFDECFVHSMTWQFQPYNLPGGASSGAGTAGGQVTYASGGTVPILTSGVILVSLFTGSGLYTSANAMLSNPNKAIRHSSTSWKYAWRNNVRFDPKGPALADGTGLSWSGWQQVSDVSKLSGNIQMRAAVDQVIGGGSLAYNVGSVAVIFDVSFRSRA